jgi:hypothetical protein
MKLVTLATAVALLACAAASAQPVAVTKTNPLPVYMHYMPWYETPATLGGDNWGYHWTLKNQNPNIVDASGQRQIASHFYPLIGPYASSDPDVIEYHMLLMKLSGVDGILIDWYGVRGSNGDIDSLLKNSNAAIAKVDDFGLKFGVVMEDQFLTVAHGSSTPDLEAGKANMAYLRDHYFSNPSYIRQSTTKQPLVNVFGPILFESEAQWTSILAEAGEKIDFNPLWYQSGDAGKNATGEFTWIYEDGAQNNHLARQAAFYDQRASSLGTVGGVAYPGFDDFYKEGGTDTVIGFEIPHDDGQTLTDVLDLAAKYSASMDYLQLATFNDFGEGTMFEPTTQTGFSYLQQVQKFTGVPYTEAELQLVYELFLARKEYAGDPAAQKLLDQVSSDLTALQIDEARRHLKSVPEPTTLALASAAIAALAMRAALQRRSLDQPPSPAAQPAARRPSISSVTD